jgi:beta-mannosidase
MAPAPATGSELTEGWRAAAADDHLRRSYTEADFDDAAWHSVTVPGHWRSTPGFAGSDGPLLYRCLFPAPRPAPGRRAWLTFDGLFYQGDVWLDGGYLGDTEGYFAPHGFEVTGPLRDRDEHALAVEVACSPQRPGAKRNVTGIFQDGDHVDPAWNPGGIWRPVRLTETGPVRLATLRAVCLEASAERAVLALRAVLDSDSARPVRLRTEVGAADHEVDQPLAAGTNEVAWTVTVDRPSLWWPRALGDPVLHDVRVAVLLPEGDGENGEDGEHGEGEDGEHGDGSGKGTVSDERRLRVGLRSIRLRGWIASVNGERLFLKGAEHGPTRRALGEATADEVRADVDRAVGLGLDLLRIQAHVARPELYDAADEAGLLLWQDLPLHGPYARGIRREAARQARAMVDLLGHHPSIALWCGHDEPDGPAPGPDPLRAALAGQVPGWNRSVLDRTVKRVLQRADPSRPVVAHSGVGPHLPQLDGTDSHLGLGWRTGDERDLPGLARAVPRLVRFVSRFGAGSVPPGEGAAFAEPDRWPDLDWDGLAAHHGLDAGAMAAHVPPAGHETFADWRDATQRYQATLVRRHVEELRRLKYRPTGGFAVARLADAQPGITPALLDQDRRPKPALDALREACRPVIVVADRLPARVRAGDPLALDVHVVSDRREPVTGAEVTAELSWPGGGHTWRWAGDVPADGCVRVATVQAVAPAATGLLVFDLTLSVTDGRGGTETVRNRDTACLDT